MIGGCLSAWLLALFVINAAACKPSGSYLSIQLEESAISDLYDAGLAYSCIRALANWRKAGGYLCCFFKSPLPSPSSAGVNEGVNNEVR